MDLDKTLESLDFQPDVVCTCKRMLWVHPYEPPFDHPAEHHPDGCQNQSVRAYQMRLCPCWSDPRQFVLLGKDWTEYNYVAGLLTIAATLCDDHIRYFREYLKYPLLCPGCGVYFDSVDEILLNEQVL
ncbi:hypothetical protein KNU79_gp53 [Gordonia phage NadineRae]|uniref:Uncharacterized protein n=1 Tax=Gordonia phage NadineRae TaxID=2652882 RepID=A0A5P8DFH1_9CAUD|nr:hypothetical protein KNU79_gp53 [Gordonia phage NadineRae]QFP97737.1 hypothetical protein SEA_NADINERAE_53 [Gordonia phage NadineRae]